MAFIADTEQFYINLRASVKRAIAEYYQAFATSKPLEDRTMQTEPIQVSIERATAVATDVMIHCRQLSRDPLLPPDRVLDAAIQLYDHGIALLSEAILMVGFITSKLAAERVAAATVSKDADVPETRRGRETARIARHAKRKKKRASGWAREQAAKAAKDAAAAGDAVKKPKRKRRRLTKKTAERIVSPAQVDETTQPEQTAETATSASIE